MIFSRFVVGTSLVVVSAVGLHTGSKSRVRGGKEDVVPVIGKDLSKGLDVEVNSGPDQCKITFKNDKSEEEEKRFMLTFHEDIAGRSNPIAKTSFCLAGEGALFFWFFAIEYDSNPPYLNIEYSYSGGNSTIEIREDVDKALKHFAPVIPLSHLKASFYTELKTSLPILRGSRDRCAKAYALLAKYPPSSYGKGIQWFEDFHVKATKSIDSLIDSWNKKK